MYPNKLIETSTHGKSVSYLIKTIRREAPVLPKCMPVGMVSLNLATLMSQLESDYGPLSESYNAAPRSTGDLDSPGPSITLSVNNAPFETLNLINPYDLPLILQYGGDPFNAPPPEGIDGRTIITISSTSAMSMSFVMGMALLEMMASSGINEALAAYEDIYMVTLSIWKTQPHRHTSRDLVLMVC